MVDGPQGRTILYFDPRTVFQTQTQAAPMERIVRRYPLRINYTLHMSEACAEYLLNIDVHRAYTCDALLISSSSPCLVSISLRVHEI